MRRDTDIPAARRSWLRWCAAFLALALVLVAVHQVVPHHPNQGRCQACASLDRPLLAAADAGVALPRPASFRLPPMPADRRVQTNFYVLRPFRGPPAHLAV